MTMPRAVVVRGCVTKATDPESLITTMAVSTVGEPSSLGAVVFQLSQSFQRPSSAIQVETAGCGGKSVTVATAVASAPTHK
jgi:hypothetical protein